MPKTYVPELSCGLQLAVLDFAHGFCVAETNFSLHAPNWQHIAGNHFCISCPLKLKVLNIRDRLGIDIPKPQLTKN